MLVEGDPANYISCRKSVVSIHCHLSMSSVGHSLLPRMLGSPGQFLTCICLGRQKRRGQLDEPPCQRPLQSRDLNRREYELPQCRRPHAITGTGRYRYTAGNTLAVVCMAIKASRSSVSANDCMSYRRLQWKSNQSISSVTTVNHTSHSQ
jgi:hypothetical protein